MVSFWNFNSIFISIKKELEERYNIKIKLNGNLKLDLLPIPQLIISDISIFDQRNDIEISVPESKIRIDSFNTLLNLKNININKIELNKPVIEIQKQGILEYVDKNIVRKILEQKDISLVINDGKLLFFNNNKQENINNLNFTYKVSGKDSLKFNIDFVHDKDNFEFTCDMSDIDSYGVPSQLNVSMKHELLKLSLDLNKSENSDSLRGTTKIYFYNKDKGTGLSKIKNFISGAGFKSIEAKTELNKEYFKIYNIVTDSPNIKNIKGNINYYRNVDNVSINVIADLIDLDMIFEKFGVDDDMRNYFDKLLDSFINNNNFMNYNKLSVSGNFSIKKIILRKKPINDFVLDFNSWPANFKSKKKVLLNTFSMVMPGNTKFQATGILYNREYNIFKGNVSIISMKPNDFYDWYKNNSSLNIGIKHNNSPIIMKSNIIIMPYVIQVHDMQIASKYNNMLINSTSFKYPDNTDLQIYTSVMSDKLNLNEFKMDEKFDNFIYTLFSSDFDNSGKVFFERFNNFEMIRGQKGFKNFTLEAKEVIFKDEIFSNTNINLDLSNNYLKLDNLGFDNRYLKYTGSVDLYLSELKPKIEMNLNFSKMNNKFINSIFPDKEVLIKRYKSEYKKGNASKDIDGLNFYGLGHVNGQYSVHIDKLEYDKSIIDKIVAKGHLIDGLVTVDDMRAGAFDGNIKLTGNISLVRPIFGIKFGIGVENINPAKALFNNSNNTGYLSASGVISTRGRGFGDFKKNLYGKVKFDAEDVTHNGFGIEEIASLTELTTS
ncbi:MAG: hypothetical protein ACI8ZF_000553, partial [Candidatus Midichloriaceae bacterium]